MPHYQVSDATERFSSRAAEYAKHRPPYPPGIIGVLEEVCGMTPDDLVADVGAGTGILTRLFAANGNRVIAVEPNDDMRQTSEVFLRGLPGVSIVKGQAKATTLPAASVDLIAVGQAFHWFTPAPTRKEFTRIGTPHAALAVVWNRRPLGVTAFMDDFEGVLMTHGGDYARNQLHQQIDEKLLAQFFRGMTLRIFHNPQPLDRSAVQGLVRTMSYLPAPGHTAYEPMMDQLERVFARHEKNGIAVMDYETRLYCGPLARG